MKKINEKRKLRKELSTPILGILIILYSILLVLFGICDGFLIDALVNYYIIDILGSLAIILPVGIASIIIHIILIRNSDIEDAKSFKWYINNIIIAFMITLIITAITVFSLGYEGGNKIDFIIGISLFPLIGTLTTINVVKHVFNDNSKWKSVLYKNGNLHKAKKSKDYYRLNTPVEFEKELLSALHKEEFLNVLVVIVFMLIVIIAAVNYMLTDHSYTDNLIYNIFTLRARRSFGFMFFLMIIFLAFGISIVAYYICNAIKRSRIIRNHEYIAYHANVTGGSNGIGIYNNGIHYQYKYAIYVGIKAKNIHSTPATLIFIPDYVMIVPDNKENEKD